MCVYIFIYLFHLFTQGKPNQLTLVFIGALHTFHIVTNMYVQFKHNTMYVCCCVSTLRHSNVELRNYVISRHIVIERRVT